MFDPKNFRLDGQVAFITGAEAGIGHAIAEAFGAVGVAVTVCDRNARASDSVAEATLRGGREAISAPRGGMLSHVAAD